MYFLQGLGATRVERGTMPSGDAGVTYTLGRMRGLVAAGASNLLVRETAIGIIRRVPAHDRLGELRALHNWVRDNIRFTGDVLGVETLQAADYTLRMGAGDCDDRAVLLAALAQSVGLPADLAFRVIAANPRAPRTFTHVYLVATIGGKKIAMDPTYPGNMLGWSYPWAKRSAEVSV